MVVKTDFMPALNGQHTLSETRKKRAVKFITNMGLAILAFLAVFSGPPGSQENLETMGVSLGPNHV